MDSIQGQNIIVHLMGRQLVIHDTVFYSWVLVLLLSLIAIYIGQKAKKTDPEATPKGIVNLTEMAIEAVMKLVSSTMGERNVKFTPYILMLALYLVPANMIGLL